MSGEQLQCEYYPFIVVGGGIAGVTCAETLSLLCPEEKILLISASPLIKAVSNLRQYGRTLQQFDVVEKPLSVLQLDCPNIHVLNTAVKEMDHEEHKLLIVDEKWYRYGKLCICTGGKPKVLMEGDKHVLGIRDTESVQEFQERLSSARRVVIVGNGGIATELVYHIKNCEVVWAIKDASITKTFVDAGAAEFFLSSLSSPAEMKDEGVSKRMKYTLEKPMISRLTPDLLGGALGPDWTEGREMQGQYGEGRSIHVEYKVEVSRLLSQEEMKSSGKQAKKFPKNDETGLSGEASWPIYVELTNGQIYGCDFVVSATGVIPNVYPFNKNKQFVIASDGGLSVNDHMMTSVQDVYAAGDVCSASWEPAPHWLQMRLWSQARQMGAYAAKCMEAHAKEEEIHMDFCFELFTHVTKFFNYKVILLGRFNAQGLGDDYELLLRVTKGHEYVKTVMKDGRMQGAILIGETDLEETFENLILNQMDLSQYGEDLLSPDIDIEDYFD